MANFEEPYCALCFSAVNNRNFKEIQSVMKDILEILLLKLNFVDKSNHVVCNVCSVNVTKAFKFKSMCVYTDNTIIPYVETGSLVDLKEVYAKEKGCEQLIDTLVDCKVCRLCMRLINGEFMSMHKVNVEVFKIYVPEINLNVVQDPVLCGQCFDSVHTHSTFIRNCIKVEKEIKNICDSGLFAPRLVPNTKTDIQVKAEASENEEDFSQPETTVAKYDEDTQIKTECIEIKPDSESIAHNLDEAINENQEMNISEATAEPKYKYMLRCNNEIKISKCKTLLSVSSYKNRSKRKFKDKLKRKIVEKRKKVWKGKCDLCTFETKHKTHMIDHQLTHKDFSEIQMYKCDTCDYVAKRKRNLKSHVLIHKDISEIQRYRCNECDYECKRKWAMRRHFAPTDSSKIKIYKCNACIYETKCKKHLKYHQLTHKDPSEIQMYRCHACDFETKLESNLRSHLFLHKDSLEKEMYKCDKCDYKHKRKRQVKKHKLIHKSKSKIQKYKCDTCTYEAKYKKYLKTHKLTHKDLSEIQTYKCDTCTYETKRKCDLKNHQLKHSGGAEIQIVLMKLDVTNTCYIID